MSETNNPLDELMQRIMGALPKGVTDLQQDVEKNLRTSLQSGLKKLDLVTREEFEVQQQVLLRTRAKLEQIEAQLKDMEAQQGVAEDKSAP
jgi:BMFP domain-containing protein YqiC